MQSGAALRIPVAVLGIALSRMTLAGMILLTACHASSTPKVDGSRASTMAAGVETALAAPSDATQRGTPAQTADPTGVRGERLRVFFSGHSLLDNPMPDWVELIAQSLGSSLGWQQQIVLGSPIRVRTKGDDPNAEGWAGYRLGKSSSGGSIDVLGELAKPAQLRPSETYNRLLITERSDLLGAVKWEDTAGYLRDFHDRLIRHDEAASSLLYQCWPAIDPNEPERWITYVRQELLGWQCVAAKVNRTIEIEGRSDRVSVIPGGVGLAALVERSLAGSVPGLGGARSERLSQIFSDDAHLTPIGTYLLAAVHYAALFGKSPAGAAGPSEVRPEMLPVLQQIAWEVVSSDVARRPLPALHECRRRVARELCPAYQRFRGRPEEVAGCDFWLAPDSPFADPPRASD